MRRRHALVLALTVGALVPIACLEPTEVKLRLSTNACTVRRVAVFVGDAQVAEKAYDIDQQCVTRDGRDLGSLVVVPSGHGERFTVRVEGTTSDGTCSRADGGKSKNCITATRVVTFQPHTSLTLPIDLDRACVDRDCPDGQTCIKGECTSPQVDCTTNHTCTTDGGSAEAGASEGGVVDSGPTDSGSCSGGVTNLGARLAETAYWDFEGTAAAPLADRHNPAKMVPLATGFSRKAGAPLCGSGLVYGVGPDAQDLGFIPPTLFATSFYVIVEGNAVGPINIMGRAALQLGPNTSIDLVPSTNPNDLGTDLVQVSACQTLCDTPVSGTIGLKRNAWHLVEVEITSTKTSIWVDGKFDTSGALTRIGAGGQPLKLGPAAGVAIDELRFYQ